VTFHLNFLFVIWYRRHFFNCSYSSIRQLLEYCFKLGYSHFLPCPFKFIIHCHLLIGRSELLAASLNKPQINIQKPYSTRYFLSLYVCVCVFYACQMGRILRCVDTPRNLTPCFLFLLVSLSFSRLLTLEKVSFEERYCRSSASVRDVTCSFILFLSLMGVPHAYATFLISCILVWFEGGGAWKNQQKWCSIRN
jgi:hypothetical protein